MSQLSINQHDPLNQGIDPSTNNYCRKTQQTNKNRQKNDKKNTPQHQKDLILAKNNKIRESLWNGRIQIEPPNRFSVSTSLKPIITKRSMTLKNIKKIEYPQTQKNIRKDTRTQSQNEEKSTKYFKVRKLSKMQQKQPILTQRYQPKQQQKHKQKEKMQQQQSIMQQNKKQKKEQQKGQRKQQRKEQSKYEQKVIQEQPKKQEQTQLNTISQQLITEVQKLSKSHEFPCCHKNLLFFLISNSTHKNLQLLIRSECNKIISKQSTCSNLNHLIYARQQSIKNIEKSEIPVPQPIVKQYQLCTLKVMQGILRWRDNWEQKIKKYSDSNLKIVFQQNGNNYLLQIWKGLKIKQQQSFIANPFLIGYQNYSVHHDFIIKFRACEIILLEEQLHYCQNQ